MNAFSHIQCDCERRDAIQESVGFLSRDETIRELMKHGFGRQGQAVPSDWARYYTDEALRDFLAIEVAT